MKTKILFFKNEHCKPSRDSYKSPVSQLIPIIKENNPLITRPFRKLNLYMVMYYKVINE